MGSMLLPRILSGALFILWATVMWRTGKWRFSATTVALPISTSWSEVLTRALAWPLSTIVFVVCAQMMLHKEAPWPNVGTLLLSAAIACPLALLYTLFTAVVTYRAFGVFAVHESLAGSVKGTYRFHPFNETDPAISMYPLRSIVDFPDGTWLALTLYRAGGSGLGQCVLAGTQPRPGELDFEVDWSPHERKERTVYGQTVRRIYHAHDEVKGRIGGVVVRRHRLLIFSRVYRSESHARALRAFTCDLASQLRVLKRT